MLLPRLLPLVGCRGLAARAWGAGWSQQRSAHASAPSSSPTRDLNLCNAVNDALHVAMESDDR